MYIAKNWKEISKKGKEKKFNLRAKRKIVEDEHKDRDESIETRFGGSFIFQVFLLFFFL